MSFHHHHNSCIPHSRRSRRRHHGGVLGGSILMGGLLGSGMPGGLGNPFYPNYPYVVPDSEPKKFCRFCGELVNGGANFCKYCGKELKK